MILFVRHGETDWNKLGIMQGHLDTHLNETGKKQAENLKSYLEHEPIDLIICSPLKRAKETAEIINKGRNINIILDDRIKERDFGEFEGTFASDFDFNSFWSYKKNIEYKKAENIKYFFDRIYGFINSIKNSYPEKNILIVSHAGVSIPFKCYFDGIPSQETLADLKLGNGKYAKFFYSQPQQKQNKIKN